MPDAGKPLSFSNWQKTQWCPFVVSADIEAMDVPSHNCSEGTSTTNIDEVKRQHPERFGDVVWDQRTLIIAKSMYYKGESCIERLMEALRNK